MEPRYIHFLTSGIASIVTSMSNGQTVEVATVGREGAPQGIHLLGSLPIPTRCFMQMAGTALRADFKVMARLQAQDQHLRKALMVYTQYQALIAAQIVACNRLHGVKARLARWLLMLQDRTGESVQGLTQEFLAEMIGSQRTTVTEVTGALAEKGLIEHARGKVRIINRAGLSGVACECYPVTCRMLQSIFELANKPSDGR
ncbi:Crp/Fnr family transcriptional regulator [Silvibacterium sp.]|uniref:Crp/Fnr family transcriptional regulator n=1 Tax=Silvibacterium sp. TaxID=1964179 RepID=UPI0039E480FF